MNHIARASTLLCLAVISGITLSQVRPLPESKKSTIGYSTVAEALKSLKAKPGVESRVDNGWQIFIDAATKTVWSFSPKGHPSYPAVIKRTVLATPRGSNIETQVLCEADKKSCDNVVLEFQELTNRSLGSVGAGR